MRVAVNGFMKIYPILERAGALVRLLSEDVEDVVRAGGANVTTRPGCRLADGRLDSDGLIIDATLVIARSLARAPPVSAAAAQAAMQAISVTGPASAFGNSERVRMAKEPRANW